MKNPRDMFSVPTMQRQPYEPCNFFLAVKAEALNTDPLLATMQAKKRKIEEFLTKNKFSKEEVSTELTLFDKSWITKNEISTEVIDHNSSLSIRGREKPVSDDKLNQREVASKISRMKFYSRREEEEERLMGVSTKLKLYEDPWKIKKKLTDSDLGNQSRLMVKTRLVKDHFLPFLSIDLVNEVNRNKDVKVQVWDQDTKSLHQLVFKKWHTSKSYVFINKWSPDFVQRRNLKIGDEVGLYWDPYDSRFNFRVLKRAQSNQPAV